MGSAWQCALGRHPLLKAVVEQPARGRPRWVRHDVRPAVRWPGDVAPISPLDLHGAAGVRAWVLEGPRTTDLWTQFHHTCCDGLGALAFLEDLLVAYALAIGAAAEAAELRPLRPDLLPRRNLFGLSAGKWLRMLHCQAVGLLGVWQFLCHTPVPFARKPPSRFHSRCRTATRPCGRVSCPTMIPALAESARRQGATLNDVLLRDLLLALCDWRARHSSGTDRDWLRLAVPMNLRTAADAELPAANVVSMVFIDRRPGDAADPASLLRGIHAEMDQIKRLKLGLTFVLSLGVARLMPGGMAAQVAPSRRAATALLTNCGAVLTTAALERCQQRIVLGDATLEAVDALAPLRPHTCAAFTALSYAGRLRVMLHYDPRPLSPDQAGDLFDAFFRRLRASAATPQKRPAIRAKPQAHPPLNHDHFRDYFVLGAVGLDRCADGHGWRAGSSLASAAQATSRR